jgi:hypothetical protein
MKRVMKQHNVSPIRLADAVCGLVMLLGLTAAGIAQQAPVSAAPVAVAAVTPAYQAVAEKEPQESPNPAKPGNEGIKVHGHWVIDVKNPDGTLVQHRVFENSLESGGGSVLVGMLGGYWVAGDIAILLFPPTGPGICPANGCAIVQSATTFMGSYACNSALFNCFVGLTKTVNVTAPPYSLVLSGQFAAPQTGTIGAVGTELGVCGDVSVLSPDTTITPSACTALSPTAPGALGPVGFTNTFPAPISVSAGQIVQVSVTIRFS